MNPRTRTGPTISMSPFRGITARMGGSMRGPTPPAGNGGSRRTATGWPWRARGWPGSRFWRRGAAARHDIRSHPNSRRLNGPGRPHPGHVAWAGLVPPGREQESVMARMVLSALLGVSLCVGVSVADDQKNPNPKTPGSKDTGKAPTEAKITKVDAKNHTLTVKMKGKN